jgi:hypothetical protein
LPEKYGITLIDSVERRKTEEKMRPELRRQLRKLLEEILKEDDKHQTLFVKASTLNEALTKVPIGEPHPTNPEWKAANIEATVADAVGNTWCLQITYRYKEEK